MTAMKIYNLKTTDSTNAFLKRVDDGEDAIAVAETQTDGKGTKNRSFSSERGGLYISVMRHYTGFAAANAFKIMVNSCVAVCRTLEKFGIKPVIRWANDVLAGGKKISGTLIENSFSGNGIVRSIVGIGLNVNNALPPELCDIATTMRLELGAKQDLKSVTDELVSNLGKQFEIADYRGYMPWLGGEVTIKTQDGEKTCTALDVSADGALVCKTSDGKIRNISSGEVSLRF